MQLVSKQRPNFFLLLTDLNYQAIMSKLVKTSEYNGNLYQNNDPNYLQLAYCRDIIMLTCNVKAIYL